jgi:uncharacterized metal-binding protein
LQELRKILRDRRQARKILGIGEKRGNRIALYLDGCGFRCIGRALRKIFSINIHYQLVIHWIKRMGLKVEEAVLKKSKREASVVE